MADILLAEDERVVRNSLVALLEKSGHAVRAVRDGMRALAEFQERRPDLVILDVMMPVMDGLVACREMRKTDSETPILFLTALDTENDELAGLGIGADDYISKSSSDEILLARIAAALRRVMRPSVGGDFSIGSWHVNVSRLEMTRGKSVRECLNEKEVQLLRMFASHPGEVFNRDYILTRLWEFDKDASDNALSMAVFKLREKLGEEGRAIETIRGVGYAYRP